MIACLFAIFFIIATIAQPVPRGPRVALNRLLDKLFFSAICTVILTGLYAIGAE